MVKKEIERTYTDYFAVEYQVNSMDDVIHGVWHEYGVHVFYEPNGYERAVAEKKKAKDVWGTKRNFRIVRHTKKIIEECITDGEDFKDSET